MVIMSRSQEKLKRMEDEISEYISLTTPTSHNTLCFLTCTQTQAHTHTHHIGKGHPLSSLVYKNICMPMVLCPMALPPLSKFLIFSWHMLGGSGDKGDLILVYMCGGIVIIFDQLMCYGAV